MIGAHSNRQEQAVDVPVHDPSDGSSEASKQGAAMALLALSHTPIEHQLYEVMLSETSSAGKRAGAFGVRRLMTLTGLRSYGSVRRGCDGLVSKLSIERVKSSEPQPRVAYEVFRPEEIFARRRAAGLAPYPREVEAWEGNAIFGKAIERVVSPGDLGRRAAFVVLYCAEGLTNAEIGEKLGISEQTVKFHLRHIFVKFKVKRRTELVSRLLTQIG